MCPECAAECKAWQRNSDLARLAMEDRLLKQMDEEKRVLIEAFIKHLLRSVDVLDRHAPGTTEARTLGRVRRRGLSRGERHALGRAKAAITRTLRAPRPLTNGQRTFLAQEKESAP